MQCAAIYHRLIEQVEQVQIAIENAPKMFRFHELDIDLALSSCMQALQLTVRDRPAAATGRHLHIPPVRLGLRFSLALDDPKSRS